ncbi:MAG: hypothetical protein VKI63_06030 [Cyanobium sp.]|nr:hypothetical protein [Cyanobium sp.]
MSASHEDPTPVDFAYIKFLCDLEHRMASIESKLEQLITFAVGQYSAVVEENKNLKEQLAQENADDATLEEAAAEARAEAEALRIKNTELQALADADVAQDEKLAGLVDAGAAAFGYEFPQDPEPAPVEEPVSE